MRAPWSRVTFTRLSHNAEKRSGKANTLLPATAARNELHNILFLLVRAVVKASVSFHRPAVGLWKARVRPQYFFNDEHICAQMRTFEHICPLPKLRKTMV
jgi:hypothetical protein